MEELGSILPSLGSIGPITIGGFINRTNTKGDFYMQGGQVIPQYTPIRKLEPVTQRGYTLDSNVYYIYCQVFGP